MTEENTLYLHLYTGEGYSEPTVKLTSYTEAVKLFSLQLFEELSVEDNALSEKKINDDYTRFIIEAADPEKNNDYESTGLFMIKIKEPCFVFVNTDYADEYDIYSKQKYSDINDVLIKENILIDNPEEDIDIKESSDKIKVIGFQDIEGPYKVIIEVK